MPVAGGGAVVVTRDDKLSACRHRGVRLAERLDVGVSVREHEIARDASVPFRGYDDSSPLFINLG